jgi:hypothetical protein
MKFPVLALVICVLSASLLLPSGALANDTNADCQVRENGKDKIQKTGPCHVFEARGHVWILLATGDWFVLRPKNKADRFVDQTGKDVKRDFQADVAAYHWPHRHITVNMNSG